MTREVENLELLQQCKDAILADPEHHDQDNWRAEVPGICGTVMCLAGYAAQLAGGVWVDASGIRASLVPEEGDFPGDIVKLRGLDGKTYRVVHASQRAARVLGLHNYNAAPFCMDNEEVMCWIDEQLAYADVSD